MTSSPYPASRAEMEAQLQAANVPATVIAALYDFSTSCDALAAPSQVDLCHSYAASQAVSAARKAVLHSQRCVDALAAAAPSLDSEPSRKCLAALNAQLEQEAERNIETPLTDSDEILAPSRTCLAEAAKCADFLRDEVRRFWTELVAPSTPSVAEVAGGTLLLVTGIGVFVGVSSLFRF